MKTPILLALGLTAAFLAYLTANRARLPQQARDEDILSVVLGDARETLSRTAVHKADSYFHGGVTGGEDAHGEAPAEGPEEANGHAEECPMCGGHRPRGAHAHTQAATFDPWRWINVRVRAPQVERHLEGARAVEMMPWFWAAVRSDPHNIEAWTTAWYAAAYVMKDEALAERILADALARNPNSGELYLTLGRQHWRRGKGDARKARAAFLRAQELSAPGSQVFQFSATFLSDIEKKTH